MDTPNKKAKTIRGSHDGMDPAADRPQMALDP
jgi:hypothetical protein